MNPTIDGLEREAQRLAQEPCECHVPIPERKWPHWKGWPQEQVCVPCKAAKYLVDLEDVIEAG